MSFAKNVFSKDEKRGKHLFMAMNNYIFVDGNVIFATFIPI